jgi:hypothetical protein
MHLFIALVLSLFVVLSYLADPYHISKINLTKLTR